MNAIAREKKPCVDCGYLRTVNVWPATPHREAFWSPRCNACQLLFDAAYLELQARQKTQRAQAILAKRKQV